MSQDNTFAEAKVRLSVDASGLEAGLATLEGKIQAAASNFSSIFSSSKFIGDTLTAPIKNAVNLFAGFDDAMQAAKGIFNIDDNSPAELKEAFAGLTEQAKELGRTTSWTATEVASGMVALARSTGSLSETSNMITGVMNAARATGTAIDVTAELAIQAMSQFSLTSEDASQILDVMVTTANSSAQTFEDLGWALSQCGTLSSQVGYSLEETSAAIGMLANVGIKGTAAGTAMKSMLSNLIDPSKEVKEEFERIGLNVKDPSGKLRPLRDILADMVNLTQGLDQTDRNAFFANVFGMRGMPAALGLANAKPEDFDAIASAIQSSGGAAEQTAATMDSGIGGALRMLKSALDGIKIAIAEGVVPEIQNLIDKFTPLLTKVAEFIKEHGKLVLTIGMVGGAFTLLSKGAYMVNNVFLLVGNSITLVNKGLELFKTINVASAADGLITALSSLGKAGILGAVVAVSVGVLALAANLFSAQAQAKRLNEELANMTGENNKIRKEDFQKYQALINLERQGELSPENLAIAKSALEDLQKTYGDLGITIEGNRVIGASEGFEGFKGKVRESYKADIQAQRDALGIEEKTEAVRRTEFNTLHPESVVSGWYGRFFNKVDRWTGQAYDWNDIKELKEQDAALEQQQKDADIFFGTALGGSKQEVYEQLAIGAGGGMDASAIQSAIQSGVQSVKDINVENIANPVTEAGASAAEENVKATETGNGLLKDIRDDGRTRDREQTNTAATFI